MRFWEGRFSTGFRRTIRHYGHTDTDIANANRSVRFGSIKSIQGKNMGKKRECQDEIAQENSSKPEETKETKARKKLTAEPRRSAEKGRRRRWQQNGDKKIKNRTGKRPQQEQTEVTEEGLRGRQLAERWRTEKWGQGKKHRLRLRLRARLRPEAAASFRNLVRNLARNPCSPTRSCFPPLPIFLPPIFLPASCKKTPIKIKITSTITTGGCGIFS